MRPAVRLTQRPGGGFLLEDGGKATEAVPAAGGLQLVGAGGGGRRIRREANGEMVLLSAEGEEAGRLGTSEPSILLADGRLLRVAVRGAAAPCVEVSRWDVPGPYVVALPEDGAWRLTRTPAGEAFGGGDTLEVLAAAAIGRLEAW